MTMSEMPRGVQPIESTSDAPRTKPRLKSATRLALIILATIAAIWALQWAKEFLIPLAVAIFLAFWLMPLVNFLERWHVPRSLGAMVVLVAVLFAIGGAAYQMRDEARGFANSVAHAIHSVRVAFDHSVRDSSSWLHDVRTAIVDKPNAKAPATASPDVVDFQSVVKSSGAAATAAVEVTVVLFLMYLLLASGDMFQRKLLAAVSGRLTQRRITVEILHEVAAQFQRYLAVLTGSNIAIGILTWAVFSFLGVEHAGVWGVAAGVLHLIPYLGPAIVAAASFLVSSAQFNSLGDASMVALASLAISALIGVVLTTFLASLVSNMNSVATFAGLMFWGWVWGIPGLLIGTPLIMATKVIAERSEGLQWLAIFLNGPPKRERKSTSAAEKKIGLTEPAASGEAVLATPEVANEVEACAVQEKRSAQQELRDDNSGSLGTTAPA